MGSTPFGDSYRTVIGHLRRESATTSGGGSSAARWSVGFRRLFGNGRLDYREAVQRTTWQRRVRDVSRYVTAYAASHPLEDWAETFSHYLHIVDATDTAVAHELVPADGRMPADRALATGASTTCSTPGVRSTLPSAPSTIGRQPPVYKFDPSGVVIDKLGFVHHQVAARSIRRILPCVTLTVRARCHRCPSSRRPTEWRIESPWR